MGTARSIYEIFAVEIVSGVTSLTFIKSAYAFKWLNSWAHTKILYFQLVFDSAISLPSKCDDQSRREKKAESVEKVRKNKS